MAARDPQRRRENATIAALTRWAHEDGKANAQRGQAGLRAKFEREVRDQHPDLPDDEIARRGERLYKAHMIRIRRKRTDLAPAETREAAA